MTSHNSHRSQRQAYISTVTEDIQAGLATACVRQAVDTAGTGVMAGSEPIYNAITSDRVRWKSAIGHCVHVVTTAVKYGTPRPGVRPGLVGGRGLYTHSRYPCRSDPSDYVARSID